METECVSCEIYIFKCQFLDDTTCSTSTMRLRLFSSEFAVGSARLCHVTRSAHCSHQVKRLKVPLVTIAGRARMADAEQVVGHQGDGLSNGMDHLRAGRGNPYSASSSCSHRHQPSGCCSASHWRSSPSGRQRRACGSRRGLRPAVEGSPGGRWTGRRRVGSSPGMRDEGKTVVHRSLATGCPVWKA